jgi:hypothetical protein
MVEPEEPRAADKKRKKKRDLYYDVNAEEHKGAFRLSVLFVFAGILALFVDLSNVRAAASHEYCRLRGVRRAQPLPPSLPWVVTVAHRGMPFSRAPHVGGTGVDAVHLTGRRGRQRHLDLRQPRPSCDGPLRIALRRVTQRR